jgi:Xaa-Pro aminopeptidase
VGAFLSVHEGPQRLSRISTVPLAEGMILSNEPGYYLEGQFGIRIENLIAVRKGDVPQRGDARDWLEFETLTLAPIDRRLVQLSLLDAEERAWLDAYHTRVAALLTPLVADHTADWLHKVCQPL